MSAVPGQIIVEEFYLVNNTDTKKQKANMIWDLVSNLYIYENIFSENMYGVIQMYDSNNLYSNLPIDGNTYVVMKLKCPTTGKRVSGMFRVYKISDIKQTDNAVQTYNIHFVSTEMFNSRRMRVSGKVTKQLPNKILEFHKMFSQKRLEVSKDTYDTTLYFPNISPAEAIRLMVENMKWRNGIPDYCYWETFDSYYCKSLVQCLLDSPVHNIRTDYKMYYPATEDLGYADLIRISDILVKKNFNAIENLYNGYNGSLVFTHDPLTATTNVYSSGNEIYSNYYTFSAPCLDYNAISRRQQILKSIANTYYYVQVPGLLTRKSGDLADVSIQTKGAESYQNMDLSGRRLICGIVHCIDHRGKYNQNITLGNYFLETK